MDAVYQRLNKFLTDWIEPVSHAQVDLSSVLAGRLELRHIQIKPAVMSYVPLPFDLIFSYVGEIQVHVPLYALFARPITATVDTIVLVVSTSPTSRWDPQAFKHHFLTMKRASLMAGETAAMLSALEGGFIWKLAMRFAKNFKVEIKNVHIRIEDTLCRNKKPLALGVGVESVRLTGAGWSELEDPPEVADKTSILLKRVNIDGVSIYVEELTSPPLGANLLQSYIPADSLTNEVSTDEAHLEALKNKIQLEEASEVSREEESGSWLKSMFCKARKAASKEMENNSDSETEGWRPEAVKTTKEVKVFNFDGRVSWRRLLAPFCKREVYDVEASEWIQDPTDNDTEANEEHYHWFSCETGSNVSDEISENFYESEESLLEDPIVLRNSSESEPGLAIDDGVSPTQRRDLRRRGPDESASPSLKYKLPLLRKLRHVLNQLSAAYHEYVLEPRELILLLTLSVLPIMPLKLLARSWTERRLLSEGSSQVQRQIQPLPQCRVDMTIAGLRIKITSLQALNLFKWAEYSLILHSQWAAGLQSELELPSPSREEREQYLQQWPIKLLHGRKAPKELVTWCEEFEMLYTYNTISALRNQCLTSLEECRCDRVTSPTSNDATASTETSDRTASPLTKASPTPSTASSPISPPEHQKKSGDRWGWLRCTVQNPTDTHELDLSTLPPDPEGTGQVQTLKEYLDNHRDLTDDMSKLRTVRFEASAVVDLVLVDTAITYTVQGRGIAVAEDRVGQRDLSILASCCHIHLESQSVSDQGLSLDLEVFPVSVVNIERHLDNLEIPPSISPMVMTTCRDSTRFLEDARRSRKNRTGFWSRLRGVMSDVYCDTIDFFKRTPPGILMSMETQLFRTTNKPDIRMILRLESEIIVFIMPLKFLQILKEAVSLIDAATHREITESALAATAASVNAGVAFTTALANGDIQHKNIDVDIQLQKSVHIVLPRSAATLNCPCYAFDLGRLRISSRLAPQRVDYPRTLPTSLLYDRYTISLDKLQLRRVPSCINLVEHFVVYAGGVDLRPASTVLRGARIPQQQQQQQQQQTNNPDEPESRAGRSLSDTTQAFPNTYSYVIYPLKTDTVCLELCHVPFRGDLPALHIDFFQNDLRIDISDYDIEFMAGIASESLELYYTFADDLDRLFYRIQARTNGSNYPCSDAITSSTSSPANDSHAASPLISPRLTRQEQLCGKSFIPTKREVQFVSAEPSTHAKESAIKADRNSLNQVGDLQPASVALKNEEKLCDLSQAHLDGSKSWQEAREQLDSLCRRITSHQGADTQVHIHGGVRYIHVRLLRRCGQSGMGSQRSSLFDGDEESRRSGRLQGGQKKKQGGNGKRGSAVTTSDAKLESATRITDESFAFQPSQYLTPIVTVTVGSVGCVLQNSSAGVIELRAGLGFLDVREECNIAPACFSSLYSAASSFSRPKPPGKVPDISSSELHDLLASMEIQVELTSITCSVAKQSLSDRHLSIYYYGNMRTKEQVMLFLLSSFRITLLWEVLDEMFCWALPHMELFQSFPKRTPVAVGGGCALEDNQKVISRGNSLCRCLTMDTESSKYVLSRALPTRASNLGYVLRPGIRFVVHVDPFEILLPCEPLRMPTRMTRVGSEPERRTSVLPERRISVFPERKKRDSQLKKQRLRGQSRSPLAYCGLRRFLESLKDFEFQLPQCIAVRASLDVKIVVYFYETLTSSGHGSSLLEPSPLVVREDLNDSTEASGTFSKNSMMSSLSEPGSKDTAVGGLMQAALLDAAEHPGELDHPWLIGGGDGLFEEVEAYMERHPNYILQMLCPCSIKLGATLSELVVTATVPQARSPVHFPMINWRTIMNSNMTLLSPTRFSLDADAFLPSERCLYERLHGITPEVGNILRRSRGLFISKYPEGVELFLSLEPLVINMDSESCIVTYQLLSVVQTLSTYMTEKWLTMFPPPDHGFYSSEGGGVSLFTSGSFADDIGGDFDLDEGHFLLNLARTCSVSAGFSVESIRVKCWDVYHAQKRCCLTLDLDDMSGALELCPDRTPVPSLEDFWWNAFNPPRAVFECSFLTRVGGDPFDVSLLENPFRRQQRKAKSLIARVWEKTSRGVIFAASKVKGWLKKPMRKVDDDPEPETLVGGVEDNDSEGDAGDAYQRGSSSMAAHSDARFPWVNGTLTFIFCADYLNRAEKTSYSVLEPFQVALQATKLRSDVIAEVNIDISWININVNVPLIDALLVYGYSMVGSSIQKRTKLYLDVFGRVLKKRCKERYGPATLGNEATNGANTIVSGDHGTDTLEDTTDSLCIMRSDGACTEEAYEVVQAGSLTFFLRPAMRFDVLSCLCSALDMSVFGDAIFAKTSTFLDPTAGFAGDSLRTENALRAMSTAPVDRSPRNALTSIALAAKEKQEAEARLRPEVINMLGQPIALMCRKTQGGSARQQLLKPVEEGSWNVIEPLKASPLLMDDAGKPHPFIIRLQILNCVFDIPSTALKLDREGLDTITLFLRKPTTKESGVSYLNPFEDAKLVVGAARKTIPHLLPKVGKTRKRTESSSARPHAPSSHLIGRRSSEAGAMNQSEEALLQQRKDLWDSEALPAPRDFVRLVVRTSQRSVQSDRVCYDVFLSSCLVVRNNTQLQLYLYPTVSGPLEHETVNTPIAAYHLRPSAPDTSFSVPPDVWSWSGRGSKQRMQLALPGLGSSDLVLYPSKIYTPQEMHNRLTELESARRDLALQLRSVPETSLPITLEGPYSSDGASELHSSEDLVMSSLLGHQRLLPNWDVMQLLPNETRVKAMPLFWLSCFNTGFWLTESDESLVDRDAARRLAMTPLSSDAVFTCDVLRHCVELQFSASNEAELQSRFAPRLVHLQSATGTRLAISASLTLVSSKDPESTGRLVELHLDHCLEVCNRLPRPLHVRRIGGVNMAPQNAAAPHSGRRRSLGDGIQSFLSGSVLPGSTEPPEPLLSGGLPAERSTTDVDLGGARWADLLEAEAFTLEPGEDLSFPIDPEAVVFTVDAFRSKPMPIDLRPSNIEVTYISLYRRAPTSTIRNDLNTELEEVGDEEVLANARRRAEEEMGRTQPGLEALRVTVEYSPMLTTRRYHANTQTSRLLMPSFVRSATIYADTWVVNRLDYPITLYRFDGQCQLFLRQHSREILPADFGHSKLTVGVDAKNLEALPPFDRYPIGGRGWFFGTQSSVAVSDDFTVVDIGTRTLHIRRSPACPHLTYTASMHSAPSPFLRTTVVEILPRFVIANERHIPLWIRENGTTPKGPFRKEKTNLVAYICVPPRSSVEFHPQLNRGDVEIQISGTPIVEDYFAKVLKPILKGHAAAPTYQGAQLTRDAMWWSPPTEISHPRMVQLRHPSVPTSPGQTCRFTLTEVEVTLRNGVSFVRLMHPNVPEYRLVNLSSRCIAIGQQNHDFFDTLRPLSEPHRRIIGQLHKKRRCRGTTETRTNASNQRQAQDLLEFLSLPFSWYNPFSPKRKMSMWIVVEAPTSRKRRMAASEKNENGLKQRDFSFSIVTKARRKAAEELIQEDKDDMSHGVDGVGSLALGPTEDAVGMTSSVDMTVSPQQIMIWGRARDSGRGFVKLVDVEGVFNALKYYRHGRRPRDSLSVALLPWSATSLDAKPLDDLSPVGLMLRFRVIAGSKVIFFEDWSVSGADISRSTLPGTRTHDTLGSALDLSMKKAVVQLWIRGQHESEALEDLAILAKRHAVAMEQLAELWDGGSPGAQNVLRRHFRSSHLEETFMRLIAAPHRQLDSQFRNDADSTSLQTVKVIEQGIADQTGSIPVASVAVPPRPIDPAVRCMICFSGLGISLIDQIPSEFLYVSLAVLNLDVAIRREDVQLDFTLGWVQIDNPSTGAYYPTALRPITEAVAGSHSAGNPLDNAFSRLLSSATESDRVVHLTWQHKLPSQAPGERSLLEIPQIGIFIRPLSVNVDTQMLNSLLKFVDDILTTVDIELLDHSVREIQLSATEPGSPEWQRLLGPPIYMLDTHAAVDKVFISSFVIGRLAFVVNIRCGRQGTIASESMEEQPKTEVIRAVLSALKVRASISDAHLVLAQREQKDICGPLQRLIEEIVLSYVGSAVGQLHKVLGAIDLLGNPAMVVKHISSGMENGVTEIKKGLQTRQPKLALVSCGRGMAYVLSGWAAGFFDFATRCFGSWYGITDMLARNTDKYSLNPDLIQQGGLLDQPSNCFEGAWVGCRSCTLNFGLSFANIFYKPIKGTKLGLEKSAGISSRQKRCLHCCRGCAYGGLSGLASTCGLPSSLLLCGQFSAAGVLNQISAIPMLTSVRPRRVFSDGITKLRCYSPGYALSQQILRALSSAASYNFTIAISLSTQGSHSTRCGRVRRLLKLQRETNISTDLLALGPQHMGLYERSKLSWVVNIEEIISYDVICILADQKGSDSSSGKTTLTRPRARSAGPSALTRRPVLKPLRRGSNAASASPYTKKRTLRNRKERSDWRKGRQQKQSSYFIRLILFDPVQGLASALERGIAQGQQPQQQHSQQQETSSSRGSSRIALTPPNRNSCYPESPLQQLEFQSQQDAPNMEANMTTAQDANMTMSQAADAQRIHGSLCLIPCASRVVAFRVFSFLCNQLQAQIHSSRRALKRALPALAARRVFKLTV